MPETEMQYKMTPVESVELMAEASREYPTNPKVFEEVNLKDLSAHLNLKFAEAREKGRLAKCVSHYINELRDSGAASSNLLYDLRQVSKDLMRTRHDPAESSKVYSRLREIVSGMVVERRKGK